jgi:acetyl esterase/lipase
VHRRSRIGGRTIVVLAAGVLVACASGGPSDERVSGPTIEAPIALDCAPAGTQTRTDVVYRDAEALGTEPALVSLDVTYPVRPTTCDGAPMVVFVHGGGFRTGDKANKSEDKARLFTDAGWVYATVNYRLAPDPPEPGAQHPSQVEDIAAAVAWLRGHADEIGADPDRVALIGHSAGAFLVALVGTDASYLESAGVPFPTLRCVVPLDTEMFDVRAQIEEGGTQETIYRNAFGDDPAVWDAASPQQLVEQAAPVDEFPPFLLFTQGSQRRAQGNADFAQALISHGGSARVIDAEPLDHEGVNRAVGQPGDSIVTPPLMEFLSSCWA